jgi:hypothetical protein
MFVLMTPQILMSDKRITYTFEGEKITASFDGQKDDFDFSAMPLGRLNNVTTTLPFNPIAYAERKDDGLHIELLNFIGLDASNSEKFPEWKEV